ncbi:MAG: aldo/keto reductase [Ruthenibacterium sp.]
MQYKTLGKTGLTVSTVGLGGIPIQRITAEKTAELFPLLMERGVNYIDSARAYGASEEYIGAALTQHHCRDRFILATKSMAVTKADMARDIDISLRNFNPDFIDLYQLHNIKPEADFAAIFSENGAVAAITDAIKAGKVGHFGATAHSADSFKRLLTYPQIETIMFPYNIVETQGEALMAQAKAQNVGVIAMKPLAGGNLTNGALAMRYILQNENCTLAIPGMANAEEILQNTAAAEINAPLSDAQQAEIATIRKELTGNFCRRCGYCAPCTVGIDIPTCFTMESYLRNYGLADWAKARYGAMKTKASACVACGACETRCPYHLPIREKLKRVAAAFGE